MTEIVVAQRMWQRRGTTAEWAAANPIMAQGEIGYEFDDTDSTLLIGQKTGDGTSTWTELFYTFARYFAVASGDNDLVVTFKETPVLQDGLTLNVRAAAANTGAATLNANGLGALTLAKQGGTALAAGDIVAAGHELLLRYVAGSPGHYELLNPASGGGSTPPTGTGFRHVTAGVEDSAAVGIGGTIGCTFDAGSAVLSAGAICDVVIPSNCNINAVTILADKVGSIVVAVWSDSYANHPPTSADNIAGTNLPTLTSTSKSRDAVLSGWTTTLQAGNTVRFTILSCSAIHRATITLEVSKTS